MASTNDLSFKIPQESQVHRNNSKTNYSKIDTSLRILLLACSLTALIVMATSKQTKLIPVQLPGFILQVENTVKFNTTPAFVYLVVALAASGSYSVVSIVISLVFRKFRSNKLLLSFILIDLTMVGIVSSATGAAGGIGYTGLKGNSHARWGKVCNVYDTFCHHIGGSIALSLVASIVLVILVVLSTYTLYRRSS